MIREASLPIWQPCQLAQLKRHQFCSCSLGVSEFCCCWLDPDSPSPTPTTTHVQSPAQHTLCRFYIIIEKSIFSATSRTASRSLSASHARSGSLLPSSELYHRSIHPSVLPPSSFQNPNDTNRVYGPTKGVLRGHQNNKNNTTRMTRTTYLLPLASRYLLYYNSG